MRESASGFHTEATTTGTLSRIDADGARPLTYDEFVNVVDSIADHLHANSSLIDPSVSGQASTGEITIVFGVPIPIVDPEFNRRLSETLEGLSTAHDLVWSRDPAARAHSHAATMLHLTSQHLDKLDESALAAAGKTTHSWGEAAGSRDRGPRPGRVAARAHCRPSCWFGSMSASVPTSSSDSTGGTDVSRWRGRTRRGGFCRFVR